MQMKRREPGRRRAAPPTLLCFPHEHLASTGVFPAMRGKQGPSQMPMDQRTV
jgi:hypothetical protein